MPTVFTAEWLETARTHNLTAFRGGFRFWHLEDVHTLCAEEKLPSATLARPEWRMI